MRRFLFPAVASLAGATLFSFSFSACGGRVVLESTNDAATDSPTTSPSPTTTVVPAQCPRSRPTAATTCTAAQAGTSCSYPCTTTEPTGIRAICTSAGRWSITETERCAEPEPLTCEECFNQHCGDEWAACDRDDVTREACESLFNCLEACVDAACQNECVSNSSSEEGKAVVECLINSCYEPCSRE